MNILLVAPRVAASYGDYFEFQLGIAYVSAALKRAGHEVLTVNLNLEPKPLVEVLPPLLERVDALFTGGLSIECCRIEAILEVARTHRPGLPIVVGGGIVSSDAETMLDALHFDYGVIGEGEVTAVELCEVLSGTRDRRFVDGLIFRDRTGRSVRTKPRAYIRDLDSLPFPDYEGFGASTYLSLQRSNDSLCFSALDEPRLLPMISSRSCPYNCSFCFHPLGQVYRRRSLDDFFRELEMLVTRYRINAIEVTDELFAVKRNRVVQFCERIRAFDIKWWAQFRVDSPFDAPTLEMLRDAGCIGVSLGLESHDSDVLKSMQKKISLEEMDRTLELAYSAGMALQGNFIFGDSAETLESAGRTLDWWKRHRKYQINLTSLIAYPGTKLYCEGRESGRIKDPASFVRAGCPSTNLTTMTEAEYRQLAATLADLRVGPGAVIATDVLAISCTERDPIKGPLFDIEFRCPHCQATSRVRRYNIQGFRLYGAIALLNCRSCNQRQSLLALDGSAPRGALATALDAEPALAAAYRTLLGARGLGPHYELHCTESYVRARLVPMVERWRSQAKRVVLYGASVHTQRLWQWTDLRTSNVVGIIDPGGWMRGETLCGVGVYPSDDLPTLKPDVVLVSAHGSQQATAAALERELGPEVEIACIYDPAELDAARRGASRPQPAAGQSTAAG